MPGPGLCGKCCKPCGPIQIITPTCDGPAPQSNGADGVTVTLKDSGGNTVGTPCVSSGQLGPVSVGNQGSGYSSTSPPNVVIGAPPSGGKQAKAVAIVTAGKVTSVIVTDPGAGYTAATLTVSLSGGGGSGATVTRTLVHGCAFFVPEPGSYNYTNTKAGYNTVTGSTGVGPLCAPVRVTAFAIDSRIPNWPITPLHGTDSKFGAHTLTSAQTYTNTITATGATVITSCQTFATENGNFLITYKLTYSACGIGLSVSWPGCGPCHANTGYKEGAPPLKVGVTVPMCGATPCGGGFFIQASEVKQSPLMITFTVPSMGTPCVYDDGHGNNFSLGYPYSGGETIVYTP